MTSAHLPTTFDETSPRYAGWRVVLVCFVMALFCWGFGFYGHAVFLAELRRLHGWPASLIATASTVYYLFSACLVVFVNDAIARLGLKRFVLLGIACLAVSTALLGVIETPWQLYAAYLVMSFGWAAMSLAAITNILGLWFHQRRGLAISLALNGASCGGIVVVPVLVAMIGGIGFSNAMAIATAVMVVVLVPMVLAWIDQPHTQSASNERETSTPSNVARGSWTRSAALRSFAFWTVSGPTALALTAQVGFIVHQIAILEPAIGRNQTGIAVAITAIMAVVGRVGIGTVIDRLDQRAVMAVSLVSQAAALFALTLTTSPAVLLAACAVFGLSVGNLITLPALIIQREFEAASFGMLVGLSTAIGQFTYAFGPGLVGLVRDLAGGYDAALALCMGLEIVAAAIILMRQRPARRGDPSG